MTTPAAPPAWINELPEAMRQDPTLVRFESPAALATGYLEAQKKISQKGVIIPGPDAKPEEIEAFHKSLGRPDKEEDYEVNQSLIPENMRSSADLQEELADMRKLAFQNGVSKTAFNKMVGYRMEKTIARMQKAEKSTKEARMAVETRLRSQWGEAYTAKSQGVNKLIETYGGDEFDDAAVEQYSKDPRLIAMLGRVMDDLSEASLGRLGHTKGGSLQPADAKAKIDAIWADPKHPFHNDNAGKAHVEAKAEMERLYKQAHPGRKYM